MSTVGLRVQLGPFFSGGELQGGAKLYHYEAGTTTLKNIYEERALSTTLAQPFISDSQGIFDFFADGLYKIVIVGPNSSGPSSDVLYTLDNWQWQDPSDVSFGEGSAITSASSIAVGPEVWAHVTGSTDIDTITGTVAFVWLVFDGTLSVNHSSSILCPGSVAITVQPGDILFLLNEGTDIFRVAGHVSNSLLVNRTDVTIAVSDSRTATVDTPLTIRSTTSGTPAVGIGTGILLQAKSVDESPSDVGALAFGFGNASAGGEDSYFSVYCRIDGAGLAELWRFTPNTDDIGIFTHSNTATRTWALPDVSSTLLARSDSASVTNKSFDSTNTFTGCIKTGSLATSTGSAAGVNTSGLSVTMNDYSFSPALYDANSSNATLTTYPGADPSNTVGRFRIGVGSGGGNHGARWRYITSTDMPELWIAYDPATGDIQAAWAADDPPGGGAPGVEVDGCISVRLAAQHLESLVVLTEKAAEADAYIRERKLRMQHQAYRALQLLTGDAAPSPWVLANCTMNERRNGLTIRSQA